MNISIDISYEDKNNIGYRFNLTETNKKLGYLNIIFNYNEKTAIITDFSCIETNKGYGSILLNYVIQEMKKKDISKISLDDMSKQYRQQHNIYLKFGFTYIFDYGPEMEYVLE